jgi:uncharacterized membrane protein YeaQ/YmgE (transglycosylase-associated protein family)
MEVTALLIFLTIGALAGWLAGLIMGGEGMGLIVNILVGLVGAVIGGWLFEAAGIETGGLLGALLTATTGAIVLLFVVGFFTQSRSNKQR